MANNQSTIIGQRIKARRQERKMTQAALAAAIGLTQASVAQIEGGRSVSAHVMEQVASALGTSVQALLADIDKAPLTESERASKVLARVRAAVPDDTLEQARLFMELVKGG